MRRALPWLILLATLFLWAGNWVVARAVRAEISPGLATVGRIVIVIAILLPFVLASLSAKLRALTARDWKILAFLRPRRRRPAPRAAVARAALHDRHQRDALPVHRAGHDPAPRRD